MRSASTPARHHSGSESIKTPSMSNIAARFIDPNPTLRTSVYRASRGDIETTVWVHDRDRIFWGNTRTKGWGPINL